MNQTLACIALVVRDYDEAIAFYVGVLGFQLVEDTPLAAGKRWVVVRPCGGGTGLVLARADGAHQMDFVGDQSGGRVFLFLHTDDFWRDFDTLNGKGVEFVSDPREEVYGTVAVFEDLYGNLWDLVQPAAAPETSAPPVRPAPAPGSTTR